MSDASYEVQKAIVKALKDDAALTALINKRVYDPVPPGATFPYVSIGDDVIVPDEGDGYEGCDVTVTLHAWSREQGYGEIKKIDAAVQQAIRGATFNLTGFRLVDKLFETTRTLRDPDGLTNHGVVTFRAMTEPSG